MTLYIRSIYQIYMSHTHKYKCHVLAIINRYTCHSLSNAHDVSILRIFTCLFQALLPLSHTLKISYSQIYMLYSHRLESFNVSPNVRVTFYKCVM